MATNIGPSHIVQGQVSFTTAQEIIISQSDDSILVYGNDGGTNRALKTDAAGELQVDIVSSALPSGAATESTVSTLLAKHTASTATIAAVARNAASVSAIGANGSRKGLIFSNDSAGICYVAYAATAATNSYTIRLPANSGYEMMFPIYTGQCSVIWGSGGAGNLLMTELT